MKAKNNNIITKTDTSDNWAKCEYKYIPAVNTIIVYADVGKLPKFKISDGIHKLKDLPFTELVNHSYSVEDDVLCFN